MESKSLVLSDAMQGAERKSLDIGPHILFIQPSTNTHIKSCYCWNGVAKEMLAYVSVKEAEQLCNLNIYLTELPLDPLPNPANPVA